MTTEVEEESPPDWLKETPYGDDSGHVGKYDGLWVWRREDGLAWSTHLQKWVTEESGEGTSFLEALVVKPGCGGGADYEDFEIDEAADWIEAHGQLPEGGAWVNINEP